MAETLLVYCTFPDSEQAERVAEDLVTRGLAACVTVGQPVTSIYRWEGELCRESEVQATMKTTGLALDALCSRILELHSYTCPEIVAVPVAGGHAEYLHWVHEQVQPATP